MTPQSGSPLLRILTLLCLCLLGLAWAFASVHEKGCPEDLTDSLCVSPCLTEVEENVIISLPEASGADSLAGPVVIPIDLLVLPSVAQADSASLLPRHQRPDWWINRIKAKTYNIADTTILYPRFAGFCVNVYNWADKFFNTYDHAFVKPTGKKWRAMWKFSNWSDSYALDMPDNFHLRMLSEIYAATGPYIQFMAVSVGYAANLNRIFSGKTPRQNRFDFNFSTSLFEVTVYYTRNRDGTVIRRLSPYDQGRWIHLDFPDLQMENYGLAAVYFLNHGRYYQGAAYNFSKIQVQSQGSWIFGMAMGHQFLEFDLRTLPSDVRVFIPHSDPLHFRFEYNDFCLVAGYGWNWVFNPHWVLNVTGLPAIGLKHTLDNNGDGRKNLPAVNLSGRFGMAYNLHNFFIGMYATAEGRWYMNRKYSFFDAIESFGLTSGVRF